jgi:hypothetical protein
MARFPSPTKEELERVWRLVERKKEKDPRYRTWREVAAAIGIHQSELSRLRHAEAGRHWGYWRLVKIAIWLGLTPEQMLGRPKGTIQERIRGGGQKVLAPLLEAQAIVNKSLVSMPFLLTGPQDLERVMRGDAWPCPHCGQPIDLKKAIHVKGHLLRKSLRHLEVLETERKRLRLGGR